MPIRDVFKVSRKTFFNPSAWLNFDSLRTNTAIVWSIISGIWTPARPGREETFDQAIKRRKLTDADLKQMQQNYYLYAIIFAAVGVILIIFAFYLLISHGAFFSWLLALATAAFAFSQAFRFHFWYFQIKHRKLGCTFEEWRSGKVHHKRSSE